GRVRVWYKRFRDDITANWPGAGDWPLEPGRTGGELDYREWNLWVAGHCGWASRQTQRRGRVDCGGCDGRDYGLLCRGGLAIFRGGRTLSVRARGVPAANANLFVVYLAEFWPAAKETWPRSVILMLLVGLLALINARGARQGTAVSNVFTVAKLLPLLMVVSAGAAVTIIHPAPWG